MKIFPFIPPLIYLCAVLVSTLGLSVMLGWYWRLPSLIQLHPTFVPMQFNTALGFVLLGTGLLLLSWQKKVAIALAICVLILGGVTLMEYAFGLNLFLDELFMRHYIVVATSHPGRMAPNTALCFVLSGLALLLIANPGYRHNLLGGSFFGAWVMGLGTVAGLGYVSNIETAYGWGKLTQMALHTSGGFMLVGLMLILQARELSLKIHQKVSDFFFPLTLLWLGLTLTVALWQAFFSKKLMLFETSQWERLAHPLALGVLILGGSLSIVLAIAVWFAIRLQTQVEALKKAQKKILRLNQQLEELSYQDGLTNIANRRFFDIILTKEWQRAFRYHYPLALIMIDIDFFKAYNDYYGHQKGDECIQKVAAIINSMARRTTDLAARYGGEEFILLLTNIDRAGAETVAQDLTQAVAQAEIPHPKSTISNYVTVSIGIHVTQPNFQGDMGHFIFQADQALYQAKRAGRNRTIVAG
ncbi:diguanylate cyclase [Picosynechococcus sp. NKBG15041c]|uniref:GGDEF domain-containing protein n=1 Tax=Picosynechococcus sp. NKBG15041c TaxID=1407650 RepID=UPI0004055D7F|nr:diguanylate cyclase [Picosynechococcus sp. NKBG15041c]